MIATDGRWKRVKWPRADHIPLLQTFFGGSGSLSFFRYEPWEAGPCIRVFVLSPTSLALRSCTDDATVVVPRDKGSSVV